MLDASEKTITQIKPGDKKPAQGDLHGLKCLMCCRRDYMRDATFSQFTRLSRKFCR